MISVCSKESSHETAEAALTDYAFRNYAFHAPHVIVAEFLYALCHKLQAAIISATEYEKAFAAFSRQMAVVVSPLGGDVALAERARSFQSGYGCSRSADGLYIALAENLAGSGTTEIVTFDRGFINQAATHAPTVKVNLLSV